VSASAKSPARVEGALVAAVFLLLAGIPYRFLFRA
jgi:hypothetical protein